jgi:hypothetical protein
MIDPTIWQHRAMITMDVRRQEARRAGLSRRDEEIWVRSTPCPFGRAEGPPQHMWAFVLDLVYPPDDGEPKKPGPRWWQRRAGDG